MVSQFKNAHAHVLIESSFTHLSRPNQKQSDCLNFLTSLHITCNYMHCGKVFIATDVQEEYQVYTYFYIHK